MPIDVKLLEVQGVWRINLSGQNPRDYQSLLMQSYDLRQFVGPEDLYLSVQSSSKALKKSQIEMAQTFQDEFNHSGKIQSFECMPMISVTFSRDNAFQNFVCGCGSTADTSLLEIEAIISNELGFVPAKEDNKVLFQRFVFH